MMDDLIMEIDEMIIDFVKLADRAKSEIRAEIRANEFGAGAADHYCEGQVNVYCLAIEQLQELAKTMHEYTDDLIAWQGQLIDQLDEVMDRLEREVGE